MISHFPNKVLEAVVRLTADNDFNTLVDFLEAEGYRIAEDTLAMEDIKMYKTQGMAIIIKALVENIRASRDTMRTIQDRQQAKRYKQIDQTIKGGI